MEGALRRGLSVSVIESLVLAPAESQLYSNYRILYVLFEEREKGG